MSFYENTLVTKQDLPKTEFNKIKEKYNELINKNSGKVIKIEEWGLKFKKKIKKYNKGFTFILNYNKIFKRDKPKNEN